MAATLTIHRVLVRPESEAKVNELFLKILEHASAGAQFEAGTLWKLDGEADSYLAVLEYEDRRAVRGALTRVIESGLMEEVLGALAGSPDRIVVDPVHHRGARLSDSPLFSFLSVSERIAELGWGQGESDELKAILNELAMLPGYRGAAWGPRAGLTEEIVSLVAWDSRDAFESSMPLLPTHAVRLYRRVL
ncbi:MAG: hypothetical protein HYR64_02415 [Fimbriimonas ginsengisoli]|uniref:ABM domain-containing protein n=1 Tax=Fimbriimonas ginsengisoli TaxID=1005039 RepID=A0A931LRB0_FIMGI|nr:hypothetical protein [Fimbriimonas ginsengisoli]